MSSKRAGGVLSIERYRALMEDSPICTIDVVLLNPDLTKTLLGKRVNEPYAGMFYTFGGRLFKNEELAEAACRIAKQETGLSIFPSDLTFSGVLTDHGELSIFPGTSYHAVNIYFGCSIKENHKIRLDEQHSEARWFDVKDPAIHPNVRIRISGVLRVL